jgi:vacuolar-type H+-ATPase subunit F/Vma7
MTYKIVIITDKLRMKGFQISSYSEIYGVNSKDEAVNLLLKLKNSDVGLILILEDLIDYNNDEISNVLKSSFPLILPVPNSQTTTDIVEDRIMELIRHAVGITIKI